MIEGTVDTRFGSVKEAFAANFTRRGERGAALCVSIDGRVVVDLWGGQGWRPDSLVNVFSVGKGLTAIVMARLADRGLLDVSAPVARYWPEFAVADKDTCTVAQLLSHQSGLPAIRRPLPPWAMFDHSFMARALAAEPPWWEPGTGHGYHVNTFGFLAGEIVRRVTGTTLGTIVRDEIGGGDVFVGLPSAQLHRVVDFNWPTIPPRQEPTDDPTEPDMAHNAYFNPLGLSGHGIVNTRNWRSAEIPSANTHASARGIARIYADLLADPPYALTAATTQQVYGHDLVLDRPTRFGLGFQLSQPERPLGPNPDAFGHFGAAGSLGFADPTSRIAFGYVTNTMTGAGWQNPRNRTLIDAFYSCLEG